MVMSSLDRVLRRLVWGLLVAWLVVLGGFVAGWFGVSWGAPGGGRVGVTSVASHPDSAGVWVDVWAEVWGDSSSVPEDAVGAVQFVLRWDDRVVDFDLVLMGAGVPVSWSLVNVVEDVFGPGTLLVRVLGGGVDVARDGFWGREVVARVRFVGRGGLGSCGVTRVWFDRGYQPTHLATLSLYTICAGYVHPYVRPLWFVDGEVFLGRCTLPVEGVLWGSLKGLYRE